MSGDERWTKQERRARGLFDASVESLDTATRSRLNRARQAAVAEVEQARHRPWRAWLPAAAAVSVALVAVVLWQGLGGVDPATRSVEGSPPAVIVEMLGTGTDLDVASEDPEFFTWLAEHDLPAANGTG